MDRYIHLLHGDARASRQTKRTKQMSSTDFHQRFFAFVERLSPVILDVKRISRDFKQTSIVHRSIYAVSMLPTWTFKKDVHFRKLKRK